VAVEPDGSVLVGGLFTLLNGVKCTYLARLRSDGTVDCAFTDKFDEDRYRAAFQQLRTYVVTPISGLGLAAQPETSATNASPAVKPERIRLVPPEISGGIAILQYEGAPERNYVLQAQDSIDSGWWNIATNRTDRSGRGSFTDESAANASLRFYRVVRFAPTGADEAEPANPPEVQVTPVGERLD
jgi:hypothetical protein